MERRGSEVLSHSASVNRAIVLSGIDQELSEVVSDIIKGSQVGAVPACM